jgi:hypothetical protein
MREKGKFRKKKMILIRVNEQQKKTAEELSQKEGKNTSEFFRDLLEEYRQDKFMDVHMAIAEKYENLLEKYRQLLAEYKKK